ncbi:MAG: aminotransferase class I/II-fold pyridoxal phosphate-dependent enzyme [Candidatus Midichloria mitochondrii]|uniref:aminotransferase class I/II-fold pyridoxal phosphate-dependent enzyme n=1 Tax=Candidatus Midichloria mitochondrii TaxID=234827 RepID=UPI001EEDD18F|nr:aminotransferase class I/II-fold pyridoxal phosphate-dependent enzyme [Candidatus Midichloria mitochondrii]MDJ1583487.1 aminotransferase class I/II-fold pyridoxal phosphate-dependent enzyme [Candidatus Midichloria mitochondrii]
MELRENNIFREIKHTKQNNPFIDFSSNDYLNFSNSQEILAAAYNAGKTFGVGSTGSRLLSGNKIIFHELEEKIAKDKNTEAALIFNSGYQANISVISTLLLADVLKAQPLVFFDKLNHSSLYQGVKLAGAQLIRYNHSNYNHLADLLDSYSTDTRPKFLIAETLYGMDGDILDINKIAGICKRYEVFLFLDEAHATGILGEKGYGLSTYLDHNEINYVAMGTFSKAMGGCGAYVACSEDIKDYLINKCSGFIYSTALSPMVVGAAAKAWDKISTLNKERLELFNNANFLREELRKMGFDTGLSTTHIVPIALKDNKLVVEIANKLRDKNIVVSAVRQPTVPYARIRIALSTAHSKDDISQLLHTLSTL